MWEARAADGRLPELLEWVRPRVSDAAQLYRSPGADPRLVVIDPTATAGQRLAGVPAELVARPPHSWDFEPVRND
ncbi:MAG: hypothetical protein JWN95_1307 [Frankiales bacterium]|nr:hypothetical protein [Frankiales bacterium]